MPQIIEDNIETDAILFEILKQLTRIADLGEEFLNNPYIKNFRMNP